MMKIRKITNTAQNVSVQDVVNDYNDKKMAVVKDFQRREVWQKKTVNEYIESVSEGTAVSGIIVADIVSGIEASEAHGDLRGAERYRKLYAEGKQTVNEDGQNRLKKGLMAFVNNETTFTGTLFDLEYKPRQFVNIKFEKLPVDFQQAFLHSTVLIVVVRNAPFRKLPAIFRKLNAGDPLNRTEMRQSYQTDISDWLRNNCEGTFVEMWPRFSGCSDQSIRRMRDIEWMTQAFMTCNKHTNERFFRDDDMDWFYEIGEDKPMSKVPQYDKAERRRFISILEVIRTTVEQQQTVPASKRIPQRTFWAMLVVAEYFYDCNGKYVIHSYDQFYRDVHSIDARLVNDSKHNQSNDLKAAKIAHPQLDDDEISRMAPDNDYYWNQCRRMEAPVHRDNRKTTLINEVKLTISGGKFPSIIAPVALASK
jgi:hypothetical protein